MKAVVVREHGDLEALRLEDVPTPEPGPGEVQVRVHASGLNHLDTWVRRGVPGHRFPLPMIPGCDGAGVVTRLGAGAEGFAEGDEVVLAPGLSCDRCAACAEGRDHLCRHYGILGETRDGTNATHVVVPERNVLRKPPSLGFVEAAAMPLVYLTSWSMLVDRVALRAGETVLVHAAGSGVGSAAIQIARLWGARVIATASTAEKRERARTIGADEVVDYTREGWGREVHALTGKQGVDVVVEHAGADTFNESLRCLKRGGRLVFCGATSGPEVTLDLRPVFFKTWSILGSTMGSRGVVHRILELAAEGKLKAVIDSVLPLEDVREAHRRLADRAAFGKVVLEPAGD